ncbi:MAG TPA: hypothetical protein DCZ95_04640 [Verrucomicrobia bacterium]|nr:MAG: hypothetical protein A2X46_14550 [Lentisphaerae bacterium GWF2_57_35]HBA83365.1 hypothetical protein [Verrucomicrobiota bacterium]
MKKVIASLLLTLVTSACYGHDNPALVERIAELEKEVADLKAAVAPVMANAKAEQRLEGQRKKAKERMRKDSEHYSRNELMDIESLYQVANKQWRTQEGKDSLEKLIKKYDHANRTGCALLYLGQMSTGKEREDYLKRAIADFGDCFYGDGVQVGAYARYYLACHYKEEGQTGEAKELFEEIAEKYPDAIDHKGKFLAEHMDK